MAFFIQCFAVSIQEIGIGCEGCESGSGFKLRYYPFVERAANREGPRLLSNVVIGVAAQNLSKLIIANAIGAGQLARSEPSKTQPQ